MQLRRTAHAPTLTEQATLVECASLDDNAVPQPPPTARKRPLLSATAVSAKSPSYTSEMYQKYAMCKPKEQPTLRTAVTVHTKQRTTKSDAICPVRRG